MLTILLIVLGLLVSLAGLVGCILPVIPGPPLSFAALILLCLAKGWGTFSTAFLVVMAALTVIVTVLDYVVPAVGARKYGASKAGVWCSVIGMFFGAFAGAVFGELAAGKEGLSALKAGWGVFLGSLLATVLKLAGSGVMLFYYIKALI